MFIRLEHANLKYTVVLNVSHLAFMYDSKKDGCTHIVYGKEHTVLPVTESIDQIEALIKNEEKNG